MSRKTDERATIAAAATMLRRASVEALEALTTDAGDPAEIWRELEATAYLAIRAVQTRRFQLTMAGRSSERPVRHPPPLPTDVRELNLGDIGLEVVK